MEITLACLHYGSHQNGREPVKQAPKTEKQQWAEVRLCKYMQSASFLRSLLFDDINVIIKCFASVFTWKKRLKQSVRFRAEIIKKVKLLFIVIDR